MSLRSEEQELLEGLAEYTRASDPVFVAGMSNGVAFAPVEYRRQHLVRFGLAMTAAAVGLLIVMLAVGTFGAGLVGLFVETSSGIAVRV
ncbi:DUF3040 domain-containing protein [Catellatospora sichuanensis]|uniref:DUF3040 domain-containing protein n=1 Tax=Catellatospora sichuanensis TaxID=1969805 RepID=UPI001642F74C|nr:DUF3040 domain-containing protein [Catellatospora sichuanensis]